METLLVIIGVIVLLLFFLVYGAISWGFVTYKFWYWFILPVFPTLPEIEFWQAVGLMFFISLFKGSGATNDNKTNKEKNTYLGTTIILPWLLLLLAYIVNIVFIQ
jgi:hypothetical protein